MSLATGTKLGPYRFAEAFEESEGVIARVASIKS
jgi:hypothetical protein